jgi:iron complex transport system substrate-binding protein
MRIATLLPAATELVCAIGSRDKLVGISHECDFPVGIEHLPRLTATPLDPSLPGGAIDAAVRALVAEGRPVIGIEAEQLRAARPELLVTQLLCDVCAVGDGEAMRLAQVLDPPPTVLALAGRTLDGIYADITALGDAVGEPDGAAGLILAMQARFAALRHPPRPVRRRVVVIEWLEPLFLAGHWTPELVALAGGDDVGMRPGEHSVPRSWSSVADASPDLIIVALCGFDVLRIRRELDQFVDPDGQALLARSEVWLLDGHQYTSRPGPRLVEAAERMRSAMLGVPLDGLERWRP